MRVRRTVMGTVATTGRTRSLVVLLAAFLLAVQTLWAPPPAAAAVQTEDAMVPSGSGAGAVELDTTLYIPDSATAAQPAPAIIVAHGFGGSKNSVKGIATRLADLGYVALAYSARGFGNSTGTISVNAPDYEIADVSTLIDLLAQRPEVVQDSGGDPRVGVYGRSYGGAVALLAAGYDDRVDAIAPGSTWNSLVSSLFPNDVGAPPADTPAADPPPGGDGVFKRLWTSLFFESGGGTLPAAGAPASAGSCGRFSPDFCSAALAAAAAGRLTPELKVLLDASSPASVLDRITAPTLLTQGEGDSLFPLSEADATARGIAANGTPLKMIWYSGGHGARTTGAENKLQLEQTAAWFDHYLKDQGPAPDSTFYYSVFQAASTGNQAPSATIQQAPEYPGLSGGNTPRTTLDLSGDPQQVLNPADGTPAALSEVPPGLQVDEGQERNSEQPMDIPDQIAVFDSPALEQDMQVVGAPVLSLRVASPTGEAVLFGKLYDVDPDGQATLLLGLVSPLRLTGLAASIQDAQPVAVTLPAIAFNVVAGHRLQVGMASTDQVFVTPPERQVYEVALADSSLSVPQLTGEAASPGGGSSSNEPGSSSRRTVLIGIVAVLVVAGIAAGTIAFAVTRGRRRTGYRG